MPPAPPDPAAPPPDRVTLHRVWDVFSVFLRIGITSFGGPAAYIAIMRREIIQRRHWADEQHFLDLLGAANLTPGPTASKMAMYLGYMRAGLPGLIAGGAGFIVPALLATLALAWTYARYGATPAAEWLLYGIKPVIIPLIIAALWGLGQRAVKGPVTAAAGVAALVLYFAGANVLVLLIGIGLAVMLARNAGQIRGAIRAGALLPLPVLGAGLSAAGTSVSLGQIFVLFLKIGAVLYGSGYVLFAYLHAELVVNRAWLTEQQLVDAIAVGQVTPGPLSSSATFIGYLLGGASGALLATIGIYLPAFVIVAISNPLIPRIRHSAWASSLLDGVNVAALGLMAAVTWQLGRAAFVDVPTVLIALVAALLLIRTGISALWLIVFGAAMGLLSAIV